MINSNLVYKNKHNTLKDSFRLLFNYKNLCRTSEGILIGQIKIILKHREILFEIKCWQIHIQKQKLPSETFAQDKVLLNLCK